MWRTTGDIGENYNSIIVIGFAQNGLEKYAGPGHWNDPDMLEIGNGKMTDDECRTQMSLWCVLAAPLFAGNDLTSMSPVTVETLTNPEAIAVDQDPAGVQGHRVWQEGPAQAWVKSLADGSQAVVVLSTQNRPITVTANLSTLGLDETIEARDLWQHKDLGAIAHQLTVQVPRHGSVLLRVKSAAHK
jgi:alpha-galactosidase